MPPRQRYDRIFNAGQQVAASEIISFPRKMPQTKEGNVKMALCKISMASIAIGDICQLRLLCEFLKNVAAR